MMARSRRRTTISFFLFWITTTYSFLITTNIPKAKRIDNLSKRKQGSSDSSTTTTDDDVYYAPNKSYPTRDTTASEEDIIKSTSVNEYSFFDEAIIDVRAGSGGQGATTFKKGVKGQNTMPDGGNGGKGGDIVLIMDESSNTLAGLSNAWRPNAFGGGGGASSTFTKVRPMSFRAENGNDGDRRFKNGKFASDVHIRVPPGTVVQEMDGEELVDLGTVDPLHPELTVAKGGQGGDGNAGDAAAKGRSGGVKRIRSPPEGGERLMLKLTLKIVADVALVGVPNAGKSTFLAAVTRAKPKIANYPFTTVIPNLGVWIPPSQTYSSPKPSSGSSTTGLVLCDVPGLIEGAADGHGLGHAFLRHVERCRVILHLIDATSPDPIKDYRMLNREILRYGDGVLASMPQVVAVNKIDVWEDDSGRDWERGLKTKFGREDLERELMGVMAHTRLMWISAKDREGVDDLMTRLAGFVSKVKSAQTA